MQKFSVNSDWWLKKRRASKCDYRLVDKTGDGRTKRVTLFVRNTATASGEVVVPWKVVELSPHHPIEGLVVAAAPVLISGTLGGVGLPDRATKAGEKYGASVSGWSLAGASGSGTEFDVVNNHGSLPLYLVVSKGAGQVDRVTVAAGATVSFTYLPRLWLASGASGVTHQLSDANTELNLLGITRADIELGGSFPAYTFSLTNIV